MKGKTYNLSQPDGVKDIKLGSADPENRRMRDFSKTGKASKPRAEYDDDKALAERYRVMF